MVLKVTEVYYSFFTQALAKLASDEDLNKGGLYPPLATIQNVSVKIATGILEYAYKKGKIPRKI